MGVVMFALVVLPSMGKSRHMLSNVELSTIAKDNFHYRSRVILRLLVTIYAGLTIFTTLGPDVNRLSNTARRAVTPVFISLVVMIVVVLIFYYLLHVYFTKPILRINEELGEYLRFRTPFDSSIACRDEIASLRDRIVALIQKQRK